MSGSGNSLGMTQFGARDETMQEKRMKVLTIDGLLPKAHYAELS